MQLHQLLYNKNKINLKLILKENKILKLSVKITKPYIGELQEFLKQ
jgi:hypothetical protein